MDTTCASGTSRPVNRSIGSTGAPVADPRLLHPRRRHAVWGGMDGVVRMYRLPAPDHEKGEQPAAPAQPAAAEP